MDGTEVEDEGEHQHEECGAGEAQPDEEGAALAGLDGLVVRNVRHEGVGEEEAGKKAEQVSEVVHPGHLKILPVVQNRNYK